MESFKCTIEGGVMRWEINEWKRGVDAVNCVECSNGNVWINTPDYRYLASGGEIEMGAHDYDVYDFTPILNAIGVIPHMELAVCSRIIIAKEEVEYDLGWYLGVQWDGDRAILRCGAYHRDAFDIVLDVQTGIGCADGRFRFTFDKADLMQLQDYECEHGSCD